MRIGVTLPTMGPLAEPDAIGKVAERVEARGLDAVWVSERSLWPVAPRTAYPFGELPVEWRTVVDPLDALGWVAARTERIGLGTTVLNLPWYNPLLLARRLTTIDVLSRGRLIVGIGSGWSEDEHIAAGSDFRTRGARADEAIAVLKAIWTTDPVEHAGAHYTVPRSYISLKPVQQPHPPLVWGGWGAAAKRRAATLCDGWHPAGVPAAELAAQYAEVRELAAAAGRDPGMLRFIARNGLDQVLADLDAYAAAGTDDLIVDFVIDPGVRSVDDMLERVDALAAAAGR